MLTTAGVSIVDAEIVRQRKPCKKWQMKQQCGARISPLP
jgi:hypothetical protein